MTKEQEELLETLKKDPVSLMYSALNFFDSKDRERLEKIIILFEKLNNFDDLIDFWFNNSPFNYSWPLKFYISMFSCILTGVLKIYPFGKFNKETGEMVYFEKVTVAYSEYMPITRVPIVKYAMPNPIRNDLFSEYPMNEPSNTVYYTDMKYVDSSEDKL